MILLVLMQYMYTVHFHYYVVQLRKLIATFSF